MDSGPYRKLAEDDGEEDSRVVELAGQTPQDFSDNNQTKPVATVSPYAEGSVIIAKFVGGLKPRITLNTSPRKFDYVTKLNFTKRNLIIILVGIIALIVTIALAAYFNPLNKGSKNQDELDYNLGNGIHVYTRTSWGGKPILPGRENRRFEHPAKVVIIAHTVTLKCRTHYDCSSQLRIIQDYHVSKLNYLDTGYNFLVGGEGNIYQALGWDIRNYVRNNSIEIAFFGDYNRVDQVSDNQRVAAQLLLDYGVKWGKLAKDYMVVGHSQVAGTLSPGKLLMDEIKTWPHYHNGSL